MAFLRALGLAFIVSGVAFFMFLIWFFVLGFGPEQYYSPDPYCDTVMSKDFSIEKLGRIKPGMDSTTVIQLLGEPMNRETYFASDGKFIERNFAYTRDGKLLGKYGEGDQAWFNASVSFDAKGKVMRAGGCWSYD